MGGNLLPAAHRSSVEVGREDGRSPDPVALPRSVVQRDERIPLSGIAGEYDRWKEKSAYYYRLLAEIYRDRVPEGASVLEIGCGTGTLLAALSPSRNG